MATAGLVLGIIALVSTGIGGIMLSTVTSNPYGAVGGFVAFLVIGIIVASVGFVLSLVATIKKSTTSKGKAIAGLIMSAIVLLIAIILVAVGSSIR